MKKRPKQAIADRVIENMEEGLIYLIGPGTTTRAIMEKLGLKNTLLGVDVVRNKKLLFKDVNAAELLRLTDEKEPESS